MTCLTAMEYLFERSHKLWNIVSSERYILDIYIYIYIYICCWNVAIYKWKVHNGKIEIISFVFTGVYSHRNIYDWSSPWLGWPLCHICVTNDHRCVSLVVNSSRSFPLSTCSAIKIPVKIPYAFRILALQDLSFRWVYKLRIYISQLIRYSRACGSYIDVLDRGWLQTRRLLNQVFLGLWLRKTELIPGHLWHKTLVF
jgi:hypothetical protein